MNAVQIDEHKLDREAVRLPTDFIRWAYETAERRRDLDEAKAALEVTQARIGKQVRDTPAKFGLEKCTEGALDNVLATHEEVRAAQKAVAEANHNHNLAQAVVSALEVKKRSIQNLVELHGMGYFGTPRLSESGKEAMRKQHAQRMARRERGEE